MPLRDSALCLALLGLLPCSPLLAGDIAIIDPYARASRPGAPTGAIFMSIRNTGASADRLVAARSPAAAMVQVHAHVEDGGIMRMREIKAGIPLPAGATHTLSRGGDHVMLMGVTQELVDGETVPLTLVFEIAGEVVIEVPVDNERGQPAGGTGQ
ncbi:MAG: copper chaperone PCu(A)C [Boseongicola sp. SB0670_bin_30]|nr:copper chaperone PCu(A)C [Boseongicola sp. SB0670_bin_30]